MNVENIIKVADAIERHEIDLGFNMDMWVQAATEFEPDMSGHNCGTTACVGGWACAVLLGDVREASALGIGAIGQLLGLPYGQAYDLFFAADRTQKRLSDVPQDQAVRTLRNLAASGEVDWTVGSPAISSQPTQEG